MILIDPKIVNLNIYNGIPHLLIPVVTDPKKAVSALHWGVAEMTDRYKKFGYFYVRDLKGYNKKVESMRETGDPETQRKLPEILIIVNELTDLMLTYPAEIEENICKLAQMGRSAGIHLIVSTRSTNSNILTNNIKRDIPSKMVFKLPTARDSRNVIGEYGAEHLFGKGDLMLYPWLYPKPIRAQGAFISEREVADVVDFLINQSIGNVYSDDVEEQIKKMDIGSGGNFDSEFDPLFVDAGRYVIERDKAYIGMLQRVFKIGFNRAARILDQLCDFGVVGEEEGTKPRKILMTAEEFEQLVEEWIK
jgi:S-DNA-T family DNA segregation ATPase FtsK/SpoIIIE